MRSDTIAVALLASCACACACASVSAQPRPARAGGGANKPWIVLTGTNAVFGSRPDAPGSPSKTIALTADAAACQTKVQQAAAKSNASGTADEVWAWHDAHQGSFARHCVVRSDGVWQPKPQGGHTSGCNPNAVKNCRFRPPPPPPSPSPPSPPPLVPSAEFDCGMREAAYEYAKHLMPSRGAFEEMHDAFELHTRCNLSRPVVTSTAASSRALWRAAIDADLRRANGTARTVHVKTTGSDDNNDGSEGKPFATVARGVAACVQSGARGCSVVVSAGRYELNSTLLLGPDASGVQILGVSGGSAGNGAWPVLSGGTQLKGLQWSPAGGSFPAGVVVSDLPVDLAGVSIKQLFVDGDRAVRARHPNANPGGSVAHTWGVFFGVVCVVLHCARPAPLPVTAAGVARLPEDPACPHTLPLVGYRACVWQGTTRRGGSRRQTQGGSRAPSRGRVSISCSGRRRCRSMAMGPRPRTKVAHLTVATCGAVVPHAGAIAHVHRGQGRHAPKATEHDAIF